MTEPVVRVEDLGISYRTGRGGSVDVTHGVTFTVGRGRTLALVGESGSGKSTVARTLLAFLRAGSFVRSGSVHVAGEDVLALRGEALRRHRGGRVALVAQNAGQALTPSMRVGAQIAEALHVHGQEAGRPGIRELLEQVHLPGEIARRYPHELSGGQQQRIAIAMAVAARPQVLVLDEPTTALDVITQAAVLRLLRDLAAELDAATLLVSHDLGVVAGLADEVAVMSAGRIVEHRATADLFAAPAHPYTRSLLAAAPSLADTGIVEVDVDGTRSVRERYVPADASPVVAGRDLTVTYGRGPRTFHALHDVDLTVRRGEVLALVGESGSGKSTLAWSLAGLTPLSGGRLRWTGDGGADDAAHDLTVPVRRRPLDLRRRIQLAFQNADTALNPRMSVASILRRPLRYFRTSEPGEIGRRQVTLVERVGLGAEHLRRLPGQLSGGQRQRVGIARALAARPGIIIADEITTALDVSVQAQVLAVVDDIRRAEDLSCVFISHDLAVVRGIADRVMVMHAGQVVEEGPVGTVFESPRHPYTRELLAATLVPPGQGGAPEDDPLEAAVEERTWSTEPGAPWQDHGGGHRTRETTPVELAATRRVRT